MRKKLVKENNFVCKMDYDELENFSTSDLKHVATMLDLPTNKKKQDLLADIKVRLKKYEEYKRKKIDRYSRGKQLGEKGKEGTTYLVTTSDGKEYAMKTFRKQKSSSTLKLEAELQQRAAEVGASPHVVDIDTVSKYIVMERMDKHLLDVMKKQGGDLKKSQQQAIVKIYKKLDKAGCFHGDSNLTNYMYSGKDLYIIDFGMAKEITSSLCKKLGTETPNMSIMLLGMILKLKELKCPPSSYQYLMEQLPPAEKSKFSL